MIIKLPNGLLDGSDLFNHVEIDELRGKQQNYLSNHELIVGNIGHIPKILEDLVKSFQTEQGLVWKGQIKDAIAKIPSGDIETILIKIREKSYGERFYFDAVCEHCGHENKNNRLNLSELELDIMPIEQMVDASKRTFVLPKSKLEVELKAPRLGDLFEMVKVTTTQTDKLITGTIAISLAKLGDKNKVTTADVEDLPASDLNYLAKLVKEQDVKLEGSIDTDIIVECSHCKKEFTTKLNVYSASFFDPSKDSPSSNT